MSFFKKKKKPQQKKPKTRNFIFLLISKDLWTSIEGEQEGKKITIKKKKSFGTQKGGKANKTKENVPAERK